MSRRRDLRQRVPKRKRLHPARGSQQKQICLIESGSVTSVAVIVFKTEAERGAEGRDEWPVWGF